MSKIETLPALHAVFNCATIAPAMAYDFEITRYTIRSEKLKQPVRALLLSDLHDTEHGPHNALLLEACRELKPDLCLLAGDMIVGKARPHEEAVRVIRTLASDAPVFFVNGNHETQLREHFRSADQIWRKQLESSGAVVLNNRSVSCEIGGNPMRITGLELPEEKYRKFRIPSLSIEEMTGCAGRSGDAGPDAFSILLTHNPQFGTLYFKWGADLTVCGHFHGGMMRLFGNAVAISPYGFPLPRYGYGLYSRNGRHMIVTSGLGDHAIPLRIHNPEEIVSIDLIPESKGDLKRARS